MSAHETHELLSQVMAPPMAARTICTWAFRELVQARAKRLIYNRRTKNNAAVPSAFWWACGGDALKQNWATGDFEMHTHQLGTCEAYHVEFKRAEITALLPPNLKPFAPAEEVGTKSGRGGRRRHKRWPEWVAELVYYVKHNDIPPGVESDGQEELISTIDSLLIQRNIEDGPERTTVQDTVQAVLDRFRKS